MHTTKDANGVPDDRPWATRGLIRCSIVDRLWSAVRPPQRTGWKLRPISPGGHPCASPEAECELSIAVVNYNAGEHLLRAVDSIASATIGLKPEIIVVDNGSTDGSMERLGESFPTVRQILARENLGFARASNLALRKSNGQYVALVNPDVVVHRGSLHTLIEHLETHPDVGLVGPKILTPDGRLDFRCARRLPSLWGEFCERTRLYRRFPRSRWFARHLLGHWDHESQREVEAISGACMVTRREVLAAVGLLDEGYFMFGEDVDWCWRIARGGWKIVYLPKAVVTHVGGGSTPAEMQPRLVLEGIRSQARFFATRFGRTYALAYRMMIAVLSGSKAVLFGFTGFLSRNKERRRAHLRRSRLQWRLLRWALLEH